MRIEIFVVKTKIIENKDTLNEIENIKDDLAKRFGGLTAIPNCHGIWFDSDKKSIESDYPVEIWLIYSSFSKRTTKSLLNPPLYWLKVATQQKALAIALNDKLSLI